MGLPFPLDRPLWAKNESIINVIQAHLQSCKIPSSNYKLKNRNSFPTGQTKMGNVSYDGTRKHLLMKCIMSIIEL